MCFTDKRKMNWIRKEDCAPNPVRPSGRVRYGGARRHTTSEVCGAGMAGGHARR